MDISRTLPAASTKGPTGSGPSCAVAGEGRGRAAEGVGGGCGREGQRPAAVSAARAGKGRGREEGRAVPSQPWPPSPPRWRSAPRHRRRGLCSSAPAIPSLSSELEPGRARPRGARPAAGGGRRAAAGSWGARRWPAGGWWTAC